MKTLYKTKKWLNKLQNIASQLTDGYESMNKLIEVEKQLIYVENFANQHEIKFFYHVELVQDDGDNILIEEFETYKEAVHFKRSVDFVNKITNNETYLTITKYCFTINNSLQQIELSSDENWE